MTPARWIPGIFTHEAKIVAALAVTLAIVSMIIALGHAIELSNLRRRVDDMERVTYSLYAERHKVDEEWKGYYDGEEWQTK